MCKQIFNTFVGGCCFGLFLHLLQTAYRIPKAAVMLRKRTLPPVNAILNLRPLSS